jgi:uncharacterized membrane protein HdeD (DUF308 family)
MLRVLISNWWLLALRGIFALAFGALAFSVQPSTGSLLIRPIVHAGLVVAFGMLALAAGVSTVVAAMRGAALERSRLLLWDGIAVCIAGLVILISPRLDLTWLARIVAAWAVVIGVLELLLARTLRRHLPEEWSLAVAGASSVIFGAYFFFRHGEEAAEMLRWLGIYAGFSAMIILAFAFRLRALRASVQVLAVHAALPNTK